ncbi:zinc finger protein 90-like [Notolabrus celidotus]|uniref:zinc finger protein 90-like n=1 Tax=Notolabrus celidotus TaxID=1203425 RepID=UPI00149044FD|nr:zinc finger protein 90-like [Notolabrus celidotus]XP_034553909.1 zinc finger protein 90-like [Notolabrus celidotus]XP_034553910.1 zinc finger protein 90-like [Notolabrus celidotus]
MQSQTNTGPNPVTTTTTELQMETRTEAQPAQSEPHAQLEERDLLTSDRLNPPITSQPLLQCLECHIIFGDHKRQERHMKLSHPEEYEQFILRNSFFTCYVCSLQFTNSTELKVHQKTHIEKKPYKCAICGQAFNRSYQLTLHKKIHLSKDGYPCTDCGKACKTITLLKYHRRTHTGERPFVCKECGRRFAMSKYLKKHSLSHLKTSAKGDGGNISDEAQEKKDDGGSENSPCSTFNTTLKSTNSLLNHMKEKHSSLPAETSEAPPAGHQIKQSTPIISQSVSQPLQLGAHGPLHKDGAVMDTEQMRRHSDSLKIMQEIIIKKEIKVEEEDNWDTSVCITPKLTADQELYLKTEMNTARQGLNPVAEHGVQLLMSQGIEIKEIILDPSLADASSLDSDVRTVLVKEEYSHVLNEAQATQDSSICWSVEPVNVGNTSSPSKQGSLACNDCGLKFIDRQIFETHLHQHALEEDEEAEEEEPETREDRDPSAQLDCTKVDDGETKDDDTGGDENVSTMSSSLESKPSGLTPGGGVEGVLMKNGLHSCLVCGKVYKYLISFRKHQQQHNKTAPSSNSVQKGSKYECPDCGMDFIRKARLIGHMRTHWSRGPVNLESLKCDQCNKSFTTEKSWESHIKLHKRKPFWCVSCSKGFFNEQSLEKHQLRHDQRKHTCNICSKSFILHTQLMHHHNTHTGAKPFQCTVCGKAFGHPLNLIKHQKKHVRIYAGSSGMHLGLKKSAIIAKKLEIKKQRQTFTSVADELDANMSEQPDMGDWVEESRTPKGYVGAECGDSVYSPDFDCWEPVHHCNTSKPPGSAASDAHHESTFETLQPQTGHQLHKMETQDTIQYEDHKYCEWECCVCDMGFEEVAELHMHYIKHATGELPIPHDDLLG